MIRPIFALLAALWIPLSAQAEDISWPPPLKEAKDGVLTVSGPELLAVPESVTKAVSDGKAAPFVVARTAPKVWLAYHDQLGPGAATRRLWSSWGDIGLAKGGPVYCAIGDHGLDQAGDARCFVYEWNPQTKKLRQIVDMGQVVPHKEGRPAWSKVHAKIDEGPDGRIYFSCTLNDGNRAKDPKYGFDDELTGGQLYVYDPASGKTTVLTNLPKRRCTATSLLDRERNIWWCNLEAGEGNALWGLDLATLKPVYQGTDGQVSANRAFALTRDGQIVFNGASGLCRLDPKTKQVTETKSKFEGSPGMRCASRQTKDGSIFGVSHITNQLYRYQVEKDELTLLGINWLAGEYTTVCELSPDERFVYFLPGSHGKAWTYGTPVVQYEIATGQRKVLAFLAPAVESHGDYVPAGTYGMKLSADGSTLFVNFNGHPVEKFRPAKMKPIGFGLTAFAEIEIPASER